jgi:hypothetical protein
MIIYDTTHSLSSTQRARHLAPVTGPSTRYRAPGWRARYLAPACLVLALVPGRITDPPPPARMMCPTAEQMGRELRAPLNRIGSACEAEVVLRASGWCDGWVSGALANAWWESRWNPRALDKSGHTAGFWQLRDDGLGIGMGDRRFDIGHATSAIVASARRQRLHVTSGNGGDAARTFCIRIMRPSNSQRKGELRATTARLVE